MAEKKKTKSFAELRKERQAVNKKTLADKKAKGVPSLGRTGDQKAKKKVQDAKDRNTKKIVDKAIKKNTEQTQKKQSTSSSSSVPFTTKKAKEEATGRKVAPKKEDGIKDTPTMGPKNAPKREKQEAVKVTTTKKPVTPKAKAKVDNKGIKKSLTKKETAFEKGAPGRAKKAKLDKKTARKAKRADRKADRKAAGGSKFGKALKKIGKGAANVAKTLARVGAGAGGHYVPKMSYDKKKK